MKFQRNQPIVSLKLTVEIQQMLKLILIKRPLKHALEPVMQWLDAKVLILILRRLNVHYINKQLKQ